MSRRQDADQLRDRFVANREKVRSWTARWDCPEVRWPAFQEIPSPWVVERGGQARWLDRDAPYMSEYHWLLEARPHAEGLSQLWACWRFGSGHAFESLDIEFRSAADPQYLAERLTTGADAAALKGWHPEDVNALYAWLLEGLDSRPISEAVRGRKRTGFILFDIQRFPDFSRNEISAHLTMTLTDRALDGTPLDETGGPITR